MKNGEAGIEQINRRVMDEVTHLVMVSDASKKGLQVVKTIKSVADELVLYEKAGAVINRLPNLSAKQYIDLGEINILSYIGQDDELTQYDIMGKNVFNLPEESVIVKGIEETLKNIGILI